MLRPGRIKSDDYERVKLGFSYLQQYLSAKSSLVVRLGLQFGIDVKCDGTVLLGGQHEAYC